MRHLLSAAALVAAGAPRGPGRPGRARSSSRTAAWSKRPVTGCCPRSSRSPFPGAGATAWTYRAIERIVDDEVVVDTVAVEGDGLPASATYDLSYQAARRPLFGTPFDDMIDREARKQNLDASFVSALIRAESNYEPRAISRKGARGLMQLMPATARRLSVGKPFDAASNVRGGVRYLRELRGPLRAAARSRARRLQRGRGRGRELRRSSPLPGNDRVREPHSGVVAPRGTHGRAIGRGVHRPSRSSPRRSCPRRCAR